MSQKPRLIFIHIAKTGGSTMQFVIRRQYPQNRIFKFVWAEQSKQRQDMMAQSQAERDRWACLLGYIRFNPSDIFSEPPLIMTMLRDPVTRTISHYHFGRSDPDKIDRFEFAGSMTIQEYMRHPRQKNYMTRHIAALNGAFYRNTDQQLEAGETDEQLLERAKAVLRDQIDIVGLTEHYDASLILMKARLGWGFIHYHRHNTATEFKNKEERTKITPELTAEMESVSPLDFALYRYAKDIYAAQVEAYGADKLAQEVAAFKRTNQRLEPFFRTFINFRRRFRL